MATGEVPMVRFERDEAAALRPLNGRPPFRQFRELTRRVQNDGCVDVDTNHYSVPWMLIGTQVSIWCNRDDDRCPSCEGKQAGERVAQNIRKGLAAFPAR